MKPLLFAACDRDYYDKYAGAFLLSAKVHGLRCEVERLDFSARTDNERRIAAHARYSFLPDLVRKEREVLCLDVDSLIRGPIDIHPYFDAGFFIRDDSNERIKKVHGGCVYLTDRALEWAELLRDEIALETDWFGDQAVLYSAFNRLSKKFRTKSFGHEFFSWRFDPRASIWTGKGMVKFNPRFLEEIGKYDLHRI